MSNYSIECAKSYSSSIKNAALLNTLNEKLNTINHKNETYSIVLLVDDISYHDKTFDFVSYGNWLNENNYTEVMVYRESQIVEVCDELLKSISYNKLSEKLQKELKQEENYSSQLFIASWCLLRLGYIKSPIFPSHLVANKLCNILPIDFKSGEDESIEIINATPYAKATTQIEYKFV